MIFTPYKLLRPVYINSDMTPLRFLTLSNIRGMPNSHFMRKTVFTQALRPQIKIFKLNPCNASAGARTTFLTIMAKTMIYLVVVFIENSSFVTFVGIESDSLYAIAYTYI